MRVPVVLACTVAHAAVPATLQALALDLRDAPHEPPALARRHARQQARAVLCQQLASQLGCGAHELAIPDAAGQPPRLTWRGAGRTPAALAGIGLSIAHAPGLSLVAWHLGGAVGIDLQALPRETPAAELQRIAALYLEPNEAAAIVQQAPDAHFYEVFAARWAAHEARLKCVGQPLAEWTPALAAALAGLQTAPLSWPGARTRDWAAAVAWRAHAPAAP